MVVSMFDQMMFKLSCGHEVVLGRLSNLQEWVCEACGQETDLTAEPFKSELLKDLDTAVQVDLQARAKGEQVTRSP
jgi:hypothetical protein